MPRKRSQDSLKTLKKSKQDCSKKRSKKQKSFFSTSDKHILKSSTIKSTKPSSPIQPLTSTFRILESRSHTTAALDTHSFYESLSRRFIHRKLSPTFRMTCIAPHSKTGLYDELRSTALKDSIQSTHEILGERDINSEMAGGGNYEEQKKNDVWGTEAVASACGKAVDGERSGGGV
jgi:hypothetical protein